MTYLLTLAASTGQVSFATMPVIVEVAKENNIRPTRSLSVGVAGSLLGITASPISAAVVFLSTRLEEDGTGWTFIDLIAVSIPATFLGTMTTRPAATTGSTPSRSTGGAWRRERSRPPGARCESCARAPGSRSSSSSSPC